MFMDINESDFFKVVKAGFSSKRKKLRSSLAGGLKLTKDESQILLDKARIDPNVRAETLSLSDWVRLTKLATMT
jgi:16S rRNA (adenine1518-N6/adenine1519-N6)-dimethyltransferase